MGPDGKGSADRRGDGLARRPDPAVRDDGAGSGREDRAGIQRLDRDGGRRQGRGGRSDEGPRARTTRADRLVVGVFIAHQGRHRIDRRCVRNALPVDRHRPGAGLKSPRRHRRSGTEIREIRRHDEQSREGSGDVHHRGRADGAGAGDPWARSGLRGRPDGAVQ